MQRRHFLRTAAALATTARLGTARAHGGLVLPPQPVPAVRLRLQDGRTLSGPALLEGRVTALQLMFTGCSATCPLQGALFAEVERQLLARRAALPDVQLISASIDALGDDPAALSGWLARFGAGGLWSAATPAVADLDRWLDFLQGRRGGADRHTTQVFLFDRRGRLALRTVDLPPPAEVARLVGELAAQKG
ncbi:SCO family protein (plasmid) [Comamonadaceae bacterium OTU4NAUVB1]|nr:SCO family protein [Comamonadaceae bacterium OTU4NAUVB1]